MKNDSYPEINALSLQECRAALAMGLNNIDSIKPEYRADVQARIDAFQERIRRLEWTEEYITKTTGKTSQTLFLAMCAIEEKQQRIREHIDTLRANHKLGATPGPDYSAALEAYQSLAEAHAELDELRLYAEAQQLNPNAVSEIVDRIES